MSHRCGGRRTQFHARTLEEPWTQRHTTLTFPHSQGNELGGHASQSYNHTSRHTERQTPPRHTHTHTHTHTPFIDTDTSMHRDKSRDTSYRHIPPWVTPVINPEPVPYPHACSDTHTHTQSHTLDSPNMQSQPLLLNTDTLSSPCPTTHTHTHTHTHTRPLIHSLWQAGTSGSSRWAGLVQSLGTSWML